MTAETTFQRKLRERREQQAAEKADLERKQAEERAAREAEHQREQATYAAFVGLDGVPIGLEDVGNDESTLSERELDVAYYESAADGLAESMRSLQYGPRNITLNTCAFKLCCLAAGLGIDPTDRLIELGTIAVKLGLTKREVKSTLRSAVKGGIKYPRGRSV